MSVDNVLMQTEKGLRWFGMPDREKVMSWLEGLAEPDWRDFHSDSEVQNIAKFALALIKEQEEQKRKWLQTIADTQLAISPTGYESEDELAKRGWEWNGLQIAWEIIAGEERSKHPRLVRCKDCIHWDIVHTEECENSDSVCFHNGWCRPDWFCADGERKEGR
jgi:hypothetical protein